ncbi:aminopeptidase [Lysobacter fragariae]
MQRSVLAAALAATLCAVAACQKADTQAPAEAAAPAAPESTPPAEAAPTAPPVDLAQLAQRLVTQSAAVKEGEVVAITGLPSDAALMEDIAVEVRKVGGFPYIEYNSEQLAKRLFFDVPEKYDTQVDGLAMKMAGVINVNIAIQNFATENLFEGADPKRVAARGKTNEVVAQAFTKNKVRTVEVGNNLYPTAWRAQRYGLSTDALSQLFWNGVNVDYTQLQARGELVKSALEAGGELHITNPNGTDLKLSVKGRRYLVSDGVVSPDDIKQGGAAASVYLPAGEVYTTPVPGSAEGKVVNSHQFFRGKQIDNLTLTVVGGKVTAISGSGPGFEGYKAEYDAVDDARKNDFAFVDFGINPNVSLPATSMVGTWVPAGAVTVGTGFNMWAGGDNSVPFSLVAFLPGSTVTMDGKTIVDAGALKL